MYALLLDVPLERRGEGMLSGGLLLDLGKMLAASALMALAAWGVLTAADGFLPGKAGLLFSIAAAALAGVIVYFLAALLLRLKEALLVRDAAARILKRG